jgi:cytochrome P450
VDSTTSLTANALVHLHGDHELRARLADDLDLLIPATEEFLRVYPPFGTIARTARQDINLRNCPVRSGDRVLVSRYAANFDARAFEDAEVFYAERKPNRHVSFGLGPHRCSGSHLARLMFQEMMRQILTRMPDYHLDESRLVRYPDRGFVHGWVALPATYTPGPRCAAGAGPDGGKVVPG